MVGHSPDLQQCSAFPANDPTDVFVEFRADWCRDDRLAILGAENDVIQQVRKRTRHNPLLHRFAAKKHDSGLLSYLGPRPQAAFPHRFAASIPKNADVLTAAKRRRHKAWGLDPRFSNRARRFYRHHGVRSESYVQLERITERKYCLSLPTNGTALPKKPRAAEFFAGIGLVRLALERQGWEVVFANDIDEDKAQMYRDNWPSDNHLVVGDIHDLKPSDIPDCKLFTASFPCDDLSIARRWEGCA